MMKEYYKYPRLYLNMPLYESANCPLSPEQAHYLRVVLRKGQGDIVRVFNGRQGEFIAEIEVAGKRDANLILRTQRCQQEEGARALHLYFAPIKKQRLDMLIEKAVELGVTHLHPILTARTENRKLNMERLQAQILEAAEQSERLSIPVLHEMKSLQGALRDVRAFPLLACLERGTATPLSEIQMGEETGFLIGPEGGFDDEEIDIILKAQDVQAVSLGRNVLRAETAAFSCLAYAQLSKQP
jgi:16S rRNA (uracil1498-N3)-methyltransferase